MASVKPAAWSAIDWPSTSASINFFSSASVAAVCRTSASPLHQQSTYFTHWYKKTRRSQLSQECKGPRRRPGTTTSSGKVSPGRFVPVRFCPHVGFIPRKVLQKHFLVKFLRPANYQSGPRHHKLSPPLQSRPQSPWRIPPRPCSYTAKIQSFPVKMSPIAVMHSPKTWLLYWCKWVC